MYTITLSNGEKIEGFTLKNNCLITEKEITAAMFNGKLAPVTISGVKGENDDEDFSGLVGIHEHMQVCYIKQTDEGYALALADIPDDRWEFEKLRANQEYIAMMSGIQL